MMNVIDDYSINYRSSFKVYRGSSILYLKKNLNDTLNKRSIFATIIETTLNDAPITPATGLCFTKIGAFPFSHLYSDIS